MSKVSSKQNIVADVGMSEHDFQKLLPKEQARIRPGMFIGSTVAAEVEEWVHDKESDQPIRKLINLPEGVKRIYYEIIGNASDNSTRSKKYNMDPRIIEVDMDSTTVTVSNYGVGIPVVIHSTEKKYVPEVVFSDFFSSSNYDQTNARFSIGQNGVGSKIVAVFSKKMTVHVLDHINKKQFTQTYRNALQDIDPAVVSSFSGKESKVTVSYELDFPFFGMEKYDDDTIDLFARIAMDYSLACGIPTRFNDRHFNVKSVKEMSAFYIEPER